MQQYELLEQIQREMEKAVSDVKAEPQLLQAFEKGLLQDNFMVSCDQLFRREYSRDIISTGINDDRNQSVLHLHLSRSGLYDHLPEGLFFQQPNRGNRLITVADMASDYKLNKKKEQEIRRFFSPFEHDFFLQRIKIEEDENKLLQGLQSGLMNDYFNRFWNLPEDIPQIFTTRLILLLPYAYKIAGNVELTAQCLMQLLNEQVLITQATTVTDSAETLAPPPLLGDTQLGLDMVCGNEFWEGDPVVEIAIGPLVNSQVTDYLEEGSRFALMQTFNRFFMPAGVEVNITIQLPVEKMSMTLTNGNEPMLGYSTVLG